MKKNLFITSLVLSLFMTVSSFAGSWTSNEAGKWFYTNDDGTGAISAWVLDNGFWYYLTEDGSMASNVWIDGTYYVGEDGAMLTNTTTPDGYKVGADGAWIRETPTEEAAPETSVRPIEKIYTDYKKLADQNKDSQIRMTNLRIVSDNILAFTMDSVGNQDAFGKMFAKMTKDSLDEAYKASTIVFTAEAGIPIIFYVDYAYNGKVYYSEIY